MTTAFPQGAKVRFTQERLSALTPRDRKGLAERVGVVQTDSKLASKPTVYFPADGGKPDLRLFRVDPRHLEMVDGPPDAADAPVHSAAADQSFDRQSIVNNAIAAEPDAEVGGGKMSQEDLDKMFD